MDKRFLIAVTSQDHYTADGTPTGLWLSELVHFWDELEPLGYQMDIVSSRGGKVPLEPRSLKKPNLDKASAQRLGDQDFMARLEQSLSPDQVNWQDYDGIYYTGGHGVMWDFLENPGLQAIARDLFEHERIVSSVCHGYCGLLDVRLSNGDYLLKGKRITGFSWREEVLAGVAKIVPYNAEQEAIQRGADYRKGLIPFVPRVEVDGRLVTGQNPLSAKKTGRKVVELLQV